MRWIKAAVLALSAYSRIPVPQVRWDNGAMKLAIAFLPLTGVVAGGAVWGWRLICRGFGLSAVLFAAVAAALPIFITGGIHMDGYCDASDALASFQDKERRLEILEDPHVGAFALIRFGVYLLLGFAVLHELFLRGRDEGISYIYVLSRCFAAWSAITMRGAKKDGMLAAFSASADRRSAGAVLILFAMASATGLLLRSFVSGMAALAMCAPVTVWYRGMALKSFGGVTGDTTGYYLQILELAMLAGLLAGGIAGAWL